MTPRIPDPPSDWPSPGRIVILFAAASGVETVTETNRRLRQFLELPSDVRITETLLMEQMSWPEYWVIITSYAARLTQRAQTAREA
jgi:hypothetical protein